MDDVHQIADLCYQYAFHIDGAEWDDLARLFEHGAVSFVAPGMDLPTVEGFEAVRGHYADRVLVHGGSPRTRHVITNLSVDVQPDGVSAKARSYYMVLQWGQDRPLTVIASGQYRDEFTRADGRWRFVHRTIVGDDNQDLGHHFRGPETDERANPEPAGSGDVVLTNGGHS